MCNQAQNCCCGMPVCICCPQPCPPRRRCPPPGYSFTFTKIDAITRLPVAGAMFSLTDSCNNRYVFTAQSCLDGQVTFTKLLPGAYVLEEIQAPENYVLNTDVHTVVITNENCAIVDGVPEDDFVVADLPYGTVISVLSCADDIVTRVAPGPYTALAGGDGYYPDPNCPGSYYVLTHDFSQGDSPTGIILAGETKTVYFNCQRNDCPEGYIYSPAEQTCVPICNPQPEQICICCCPPPCPAPCPPQDCGCGQNPWEPDCSNPCDSWGSHRPCRPCKPCKPSWCYDPCQSACGSSSGCKHFRSVRSNEYAGNATDGSTSNGSSCQRKSSCCCGSSKKRSCCR